MQTSRRIFFCKVKEGTVIGDDKNGIERWKEYYQTILNPDNTRENNNDNEDVIEEDHVNVTEPTCEEVEKIIGRLNNK